jgi:hypothetical protein
VVLKQSANHAEVTKDPKGSIGMATPGQHMIHKRLYVPPMAAFPGLLALHGLAVCLKPICTFLMAAHTER